jgi:S-adenosylmethionine hydrolase
MRPIITLITDFGTGSPYVGQMKGVILSLCPEARLVDITHGIGPQNVREGAVVLADTAPRFPAGTIHVAVVDPGVGTQRKLVYARIGSQQYLAPDNGLLSLLTVGEAVSRLISLEVAAFWLSNPTSTFHGRDILAPVAARLAGGLDPGRLGPPHPHLVQLTWPQPIAAANEVRGEVLYVDSFGNAITNLRLSDLAAVGGAADLVIECGSRQILGLVQTYGDAPAGSVVALFDSQGRLEIAVARGSAAALLEIAAGAPVRAALGPS